MSKIAAVSIAALIALTAKMSGPGTHRVGRVGYDFGEKAQSLEEDSNDIVYIDCSGFVRYTAAKCSGEKCILPDGSANIHEFCEAMKLPKVPYSAVASDTSRLFIGFITPTKTEDGHVWWVQSGRTMESHGGRGVDRRAWNTTVLAQHVGACYVFPSVA